MLDINYVETKLNHGIVSYAFYQLKQAKMLFAKKFRPHKQSLLPR